MSQAKVTTAVTQVSKTLIDSAAMEIEAVLAKLSTRREGLTGDEARTRFAKHGPNELAKDQQTSLLMLLWGAVLNPLVILLLFLDSPPA